MTVTINDEDRDWALNQLMFDGSASKDRFYIDWPVMARLYDLLKYGSGNAPNGTASDTHP